MVTVTNDSFISDTDPLPDVYYKRWARISAVVEHCKIFSRSQNNFQDSRM